MLRKQIPLPVYTINGRSETIGTVEPLGQWNLYIVESLGQLHVHVQYTHCRSMCPD